MGYRLLQNEQLRNIVISLRRALERAENWLEKERDQLPLWIPVGLGLGIAAWFIIPFRSGWIAFLCTCFALILAGATFGWRRRCGRALSWFAGAALLGCGLIWGRAEYLTAPILEYPAIAQFDAEIIGVEVLVARDAVRLLLKPIAAPKLPPKIRITVPSTHAPAGLNKAAIIRLRARIMPPPDAAVPGAYDFARIAWFRQIGGTGRALGPVTVLTPHKGTSLSDIRQRLSAHIRTQLPGAQGGIAAAFATGDQGAIPLADAQAMRQSGLAHLLSISGLHVTAAVGATMILIMRLLALSPYLALRLPLLLIAASAGAVAGIGYTLLTGAEVPTIRACVAAILILIGLAIGRDAITLRLVATGALIVLLLWPEALMGPSFQLSFAAVTAIIALHEQPRIKMLLMRREEGFAARFARIILGLVLTGLAVELALTPIALYHFHKSGLYGALANIVAIPLTTFVIMPLEAMALLADSIGLGAPFWWLTKHSLALLIGLAHLVAGSPGAVTTLAAISNVAFAGMIIGGLWLLLWRTRVRIYGLIPLFFAVIWAVTSPAPDIIITGDGRHVAVRDIYGDFALLRPRARDYIRATLSENAGFEGLLADMDDLPNSRCSPDSCVVDRTDGGRTWRIMATRSRYIIPYAQFAPSCANADIVISDRKLPIWCKPRWLKLDRPVLDANGGMVISLSGGRIRTTHIPGADHPWLRKGDALRSD